VCSYHEHLSQVNDEHVPWISNFTLHWTMFSELLLEIGTPWLTPSQESLQCA
jgi:hypothetical protein